MITPWGKADNKKVYAEGIVFYSTPGHGGFKINKKQRLSMPKHLQNKDGWYEEDCEALKVYLAFPDLFSHKDMEDIKKSYDHWFNEDGTYRNDH